MLTNHTLAFLMLAMTSLAATQAAADDCIRFEEQASEIRAMRDANPNDGVAVGEKTLLEMSEGRAPCGRARALVHGSIGSNLHILGRNEEALLQFEQALAVSGSDSQADVLAILHRGAGVVSADLEAHDRALEHYLASLAASEAMDDVIEAAKTSSNIGNLYNTLGQLDASRAFHERALASFEESGWAPGIAGASINLGSLMAKFAVLAEDDGDTVGARQANGKLLNHNLRALTIFEELGNQRGISYASSNIATAMDRLDRADEAMAYHTRALRLRREIGDVFGVVESLFAMAASQIRLGRYPEAERLLDEAQAVLPQDNHSLRLNLWQHRVALEEGRQDFQAALAAQREITQVRAEIAEEAARIRVDAMRATFDAEQRERLIELLQREANIAELESRRQTTRLQGSLAIAALLVVVIVLLYSKYRTKARLSAENSRAARRDSLTGLANRRDIREKIEHGIAHQRKSGQTFSLLMADIDDFKPINDELGHEAGDQALIHMADILVAHVRGRDATARWGGEEFLLYLPDTTIDAAESVAINLQTAIAASPVKLGDRRTVLNMTFGVTEFRPGQTLDDCIKQADQAMYRGKAEGKNRVAVCR
ncbi:MAG: diguanylate cyclase [Wenzhouxiangella sp.]